MWTEAAARCVTIAWRQGTEDYSGFMKTSQHNRGLAHAIRRLGPATRQSLAGLGHAWRHEAAFRHELWLLAAGTAIALWLDVPLAARAALIAPLVLVLVIELLNSAIEAVVDLASPEHHELAGRAKDLASAAVMVALTIAGATWIGVLGWVALS